MSREISSIQGVIEFALEKEAESEGLYQILARQSDSARAAEIFNELAVEESKHHRALTHLDSDHISSIKVGDIADLKISDYLKDVSYSPDMTYQDILVFAMKNEEHSHSLYEGLAAHAEDPELKGIFEFLAKQEARHKLRLETEYDDYILKED